MGPSPCFHARLAPYYEVVFCPEKSWKKYKKSLKPPYFSTNFTNSTNLQLYFVYFRQLLFFLFVSSLIISLYFIVLFAYSSVDNIVNEFRWVRIHFYSSLKSLYVFFLYKQHGCQTCFLCFIFYAPCQQYCVVNRYWYIVGVVLLIYFGISSQNRKHICQQYCVVEWFWSLDNCNW